MKSDIRNAMARAAMPICLAASLCAHGERLRLGNMELGFTVELGAAGTNAVETFDERAMADFREEERDGRRVGTWRGHGVCGADFAIKVEAEKSADGAWSYSYTYSGNSSDRFLRRVKFPELSAPADARSDVFVPYSMGMVVHCDWPSVKDGAAVWEYPHGEFRALRFAALLNGSGANPSVYLDWRTDGRVASNVHCHKDRDGFARIAVFYDLPFAAEAQSASVQPFTGVVREYAGSWWEAAQFYRQWAVTRPYYADMKARAAERGRLRDVSMWFWNRGESEHVIAPVEKFMADAGVPVALDWYWWHKIPYDTGYPNFWPPREGVEKFRAAVERAKRVGIYTQVYVNGVSRGEDDPDWANGGEDEAWWWSPVREPGRSPRRVVYNKYSNVGLVEMCGEAPVFQKKIRDVVRHLVRDGGLEAVYLDQIVCTCQNPCFNPRHSHAPGDSDAPAKGYADFVRKIRAENPGVHFSSEDVGESYLGLFDSHIVLCDSFERFGWWGSASETVPAFQAIFNDVAVLFGAYTMMDGIPPYDANWPPKKKWKRELDWPALFPDQFAVELARSAVHGMQPCVHNFRLENASDPRLKDDYAFLVATARWRHENAAFLADALLANPGRMETAAKTAKFCSRGTYNAEGQYSTRVRDGIPAVMHSVWRGKDGAVRAMLVNWTREPQAYKLTTPDISASGTLPPRTRKTLPARADWMRGSFGLSVHWTALCALEDGTRLPFEEAVDRFDVKRFADSLEAAGARHCIFTVAHGLQMLPCPNAALDAIDPGRTTKRDLVGEIISELGRRGIRFIAYYNHSCNGESAPVMAWKKKCAYPCDDDGTGSMETFASNYCAIVTDLSRRYGKGISAWWFDSAYSVDTTGPVIHCKGKWSFPWASLIAAARSGNKSAAVTINAGIGKNHLYSPDIDYYAGEAYDKDQAFTPPVPGIVGHRWMCIDSPVWVFSREFAKKNGGFVPLRYSPETLRDYVRVHTAAGRMVTFNVLIDQSGKLNPAISGLSFK